jgi:phage shock protein PspC (stress-responsive transcriptional regulator)
MKAVFHLFLGFGTLLLLLLAAYIIISITVPPVGDQIVNEVGELAGAVAGSKP